MRHVTRAPRPRPRPRTIQERRELARQRTRRERRVAAAVTLVAVLVVAAAFLALSRGSSSIDPSAAHSHHAPPKPPQEPRGGRELLPRYRIVAYYGAPQDPGLGQLGIGSPAHAVSKLAAQAAPYAAAGRPVMPALELISTLVTAAPGDDGKYRYRQSDEVIRRYLDEARRAKALLVLDIQPGRARFMDEVRAFEPYLKLDAGGRTERHIIAVAPGENRWLMRLEEFLTDTGDRVRREAGR